jgi:hypothetical protein
MEFGFIFPAGFKLPHHRAQVKKLAAAIVGKRMGYAILIPASYQADNGAGLTQGIIGLVNKGQPRKPVIGEHFVHGRGEPVVHWIILKPTKASMRNMSALKASHVTGKQRSLQWL